MVARRDRRQGGRGPARDVARLPSREGRQGRPERRHQDPAQGGPPLVAAYNEKLDADAFMTLLDWAYLAVHNGDLDSRDNIGLRAIYDWSRDEVAFPALRRWIEERPRRRPAQAHGLRPGGAARRRSSRTGAASWCGSGATRASS